MWCKWQLRSINVKENRRGNQGWADKRHMHNWAPNTEQRQTKQKHNTQNRKDQQHKTGDEPRCSRRVSSSCFVWHMCRVTHTVIMLGTYCVYNTMVVVLSYWVVIRDFVLLICYHFLCWHIHVIYFLLWYKTHSVLMYIITIFKPWLIRWISFNWSVS